MFPAMLHFNNRSSSSANLSLLVNGAFRIVRNQIETVSALLWLMRERRDPKRVGLEVAAVGQPWRRRQLEGTPAAPECEAGSGLGVW
jgi:hypothetical protein